MGHVWEESGGGGGGAAVFFPNFQTSVSPQKTPWGPLKSEFSCDFLIPFAQYKVNFDIKGR